MLKVGATMRTMCPRRLYMTATLAPSLEAHFRKTLSIGNDYHLVREKTNRRNLRYRWLHVEGSEAQQKEAAQCVSSLDDMPGSRGIIYCRSIADCEKLAADHGFDMYHSKMDESEKAASMENERTRHGCHNSARSRGGYT